MSRDQRIIWLILGSLWVLAIIWLFYSAAHDPNPMCSPNYPC